MSTHTCPNCENVFSKGFCNNCGQKVVHRITLSHLWHDLIHAFTHADKGFFYLMMQLFKRPGAVARDYIIDGKRKRYFMPLQYLIIIGAIATFVVVNTHYIENTIKELGGIQGMGKVYSARQQAFMQQMTLIQSKYYNIMIMLQLPFYTLAAFWIYKKKGYNYAELLTLQTFVSAQTTILGLALILLVTFTRSNPFMISTVMMIVTLTYQVITYMQFFREYSFRGFIKALFSYILGLILFFSFSIIIGMLIGIFYGMFASK